ncbi:MAG: MtaA/CmuA family methyltransferase [Planctomycetes bacterium]|nr:MtaA/CmuA family methyltransferase [Planctomycetota bacterium]
MKLGEMSSRERVMAALGQRPTDRPALGSATSVIVTELMDVAGAAFPEAHLDAELMARLAATARTELQHDIVMPYFSVHHEAAALGCHVEWGRRDLMPDSRHHPWTTVDDVTIPVRLLDHPACRVICDAVRLLRQRLPDIAVLGKVFGPWTLAYHLFGTQEFLMMTLLDPPQVHEILRRLKEVTVAFARAQIEAGADALTLADHATGDLCSPEAYRDFLMPVHRELVDRIAAPLVLHICGNTLSRLQYICDTGVPCFHIDTKVPCRAAREAVDGRLALMGGVNNPRTICFGRPADLEGEIAAALEARFEIIGPECAVPLNAPLSQMRALTETFLKLVAQ